jgi:hypothetical protein
MEHCAAAGMIIQGDEYSRGQIFKGRIFKGPIFKRDRITKAQENDTKYYRSTELDMLPSYNKYKKSVVDR